MNMPIRSDNKSGAPGVNWCKARKKWLVTLRFDGKFKSLGYHSDFEFAALVSEEARDKFFGDFPHRNVALFPGDGIKDGTEIEWFKKYRYYQ